MAEPRPFYAIQPAFTGGEISGEVASRVDLEKYQLALLQAENAIIRPYGPVYKRPGSIYAGRMKYDDRDAILVRFEYTVEITYLLEIGEKYIRIWRDGNRLSVELETPFETGDLRNLRFVQSVDVMYICSGRLPVQKLSRYSEGDWRISEIAWTRMAYGDINNDEAAKIEPSGRDGNIEITAAKDIFTDDRIGDTMKIEQYVNGGTVSASAGANSSSYTTQEISASAGTVCKIKKTGTGSCNVTVNAYSSYKLPLFKYARRYKWTDIWSKSGAGDWEDSMTLPATINGDRYENVFVLRIDGIQGELKIELSLSNGYEYKREFIVDDKSVYTRSVIAGKTWKIITHGTWSGQVVVQQSKDDGNTWVDLRTYTSTNDYNPTESGDVDEYSLLRIRARITGGTCNADLSAYPYRHEGYVTITGVTDAKHASAKVDKILGGLEATADWYWGAWSKINGYPRCAAFFQDRLCFGGCRKYPQRLWMSRSGDYENFGVEKESGTVTDDSAVTADLLSRQAYSISHMDVGNDLVIFTDGNTWTIAGGETVKPTNITPKNQENYGCSGVPPLRIGNRIIYIQRRGSIIRDTGYSYETDGYIGIDLTLLAKHLLRGREIVSAAYAQEPDSLVYFVTDDGQMLCLTYVIDQKVYAWSHFVTDGKYKAVCAVNAGNNDRIYAVVERRIGGKTVRYLEYFAPHGESESEQDYIIEDAAVTVTYPAAQTEIPGKDILDGKHVVIMADGYLYEGITMNADAKLPQAAKRITVGLPYTMTLEQPNWDVGNTDSGTVQGRRKTVTNAILRLTKSYGGRIGQSAARQDDIVYDPERMELDENILYTGDKEVTLPAGGWNNEGRTVITHDTPYPFSLSAIIRRVSFGG
jgi:hypothetical protein